MFELNQSDIFEAGSTLTHYCHEAAATSGWWVDPVSGLDVRDWPDHLLKLWVGTKLALVHSEVSEGLEGYRKGLKDDHLPNRPSLEVELADAVIRCFDLAGGLSFDLAGAIAEKLAYNQKRADHKLSHRTAEHGKAF
jgi:NTP pyrophosphatase (non-canonical NTP hydrolase)